MGRWGGEGRWRASMRVLESPSREGRAAHRASSGPGRRNGSAPTRLPVPSRHHDFRLGQAGNSGGPGGVRVDEVAPYLGSLAVDCGDQAASLTILVEAAAEAGHRRLARPKTESGLGFWGEVRILPVRVREAGSHPLTLLGPYRRRVFGIGSEERALEIETRWAARNPSPENCGFERRSSSPSVMNFSHAAS